MIGFLDSGIGGVNVLIECAKLFDDDFVYVCDNKNAPFGNKTKKQLLEIAVQNIDFMIKKYNTDVVCIACNTISASVGDKLQAMYNIPIVLTTFSEKKVYSLTKDVLFLATKNTIKNSVQIKELTKLDCFYSLHINNLPKMIDDNMHNLDNLQCILKKHCSRQKFKNIKTVVLGCTHFKSIKKQLAKSFYNKVKFYEYEKEVAMNVKKYIMPKKRRSFTINLTEKNQLLYVQMKKYLYKHLKN